MTTPLVILDTETTSLRRDRRAWEVAMIRIDGSGVREYKAFVEDVDLSEADPQSLAIGRFYDRHPLFAGRIGARLAEGSRRPEADVAARVEEWTRGAHVFGSNPAFDLHHLDTLLREYKLCPAWHYKPHDIADRVAGYLAGKGEPVGLGRNSEALSLLVGVNPDEFDRHTALGDCKWVLAQLEVVAPELIAAAKGEGRG